MKRFTQIIAVLLEIYALVLAHLQGLGGLRTDEAKYLLSIPYPHPPFMRSILSFTEILPFQEWLWRAIFATVLIQSVWLVWSMAKRLPYAERFAVAVTWVFSASMLTQAGTIMMATVTGFQGLLFVWLMYRGEQKASDFASFVPRFFKRTWKLAVSTWKFFRGKQDHEKAEWYAFWVGILWFASLFTAYQIVLFLPIIIAVFAGLPVSRNKRIFYFLAPVVALVVYTVGSPLIIASFAIQGSKDMSASVLMRFVHMGWLWVLAGSGFGAVLGVWGILRSKSWALILTFILMSLAMCMAWQQYYGILFSPLLVAGLLHFFHYNKLKSFPYSPLVVFATAVLVGIVPPWTTTAVSREVVNTVEQHATQSGALVIYGFFGHDWQYESLHRSVRRYTPQEFKNASALVCTNNCDAIRKEGMLLVTDHPVEVWVRHK